MYKYLCLLIIFILPQQAVAAEKIIGGFGIRLGSVFNLKNAVGKWHLNDGTPMYIIIPPKPFPKFSTYYLLITPKTHKIYSIWGEEKSKNNETCKNDQSVLMHILKKKYGIDKDKEGLFDDLLDQKSVTIGGRRILTKCSGFGDVTFDIKYLDGSLADIAEQERIALESSKLDSDSL